MPAPVPFMSGEIEVVKYLVERFPNRALGGEYLAWMKAACEKLDERYPLNTITLYNCFRWEHVAEDGEVTNSYILYISAFRPCEDEANRVDINKPWGMEGVILPHDEHDKITRVIPTSTKGERDSAQKLTEELMERLSKK